MLTVADIQRWDAEAVREVFHAAAARAEVTSTVSRELSALAIFETWGGETATAAKHTNAQIRQDLDAHGAEAIVVAQAAGRAATGIEHVQHELAALEITLSGRRLAIDPLADRIVPAAGLGDFDERMSIDQRQLQPVLTRIVDRANTVNRQLADAINMADGDKPVPPGPHDNRPDIQRALAEPPPTEPGPFHELWGRLTGEEKDWLYERDHAVGDSAGMDFVDKDHYNRRYLGELVAANQAELDRLAGEHPEWVDAPFPAGLDGSLPDGWTDWKKRWDHATHTGDGYRAVQDALTAHDGMPCLLGFLDADGHAAISIGDPDHATRTAVFVPGTGQDLARWPYSDEKSTAMVKAALAADPTLRKTDVSVTTWLGYDRPMNLWEAAWPDRARHGGESLARFEDGMRASHVGARAINTVIGHSYGAVVVGDAASDGHRLAADNVVSVGGPGMLVRHAGDLHLDPGATVYAMRARNDIIQLAAGGLGLGPCTPESPDFGATVLGSDPGPAFAGIFPSVDAHSSYWNPGNIALANLGAVIAGVEPPKIEHR